MDKLRESARRLRESPLTPELAYEVADVLDAEADRLEDYARQVDDAFPDIKLDPQ